MITRLFRIGMEFDVSRVAKLGMFFSLTTRRVKRHLGKVRFMKLIMAIVKPARLDAVREALIDIGIQGLTSSEVSGFGRQKGHTEIYRGAEYAVSFVPKTKIEVVVADDQTEAAVTAIQTAAATGSIGDGKIFVVDVAQALRIRTGEAGDEAL